jgi:hypothetical protein
MPNLPLFSVSWQKLCYNTLFSQAENSYIIRASWVKPRFLLITKEKMHHMAFSNEIFLFKMHSAKSIKSLSRQALRSHSNITWHSWGGVSDSVTKWHKGEGGGLPKCHVTFFPKFLSTIFGFCALFKGFMDIIFGKIKMSHHIGA